VRRAKDRARWVGDVDAVFLGGLRRELRQPAGVAGLLVRIEAALGADQVVEDPRRDLVLRCGVVDQIGIGTGRRRIGRTTAASGRASARASAGATARSSRFDFLLQGLRKR